MHYFLFPPYFQFCCYFFPQPFFSFCHTFLFLSLYVLYFFPTPLPYHTEVYLCHDIALTLSLYFLVVCLYCTDESHCIVTKMCGLKNYLVGVREKIWHGYTQPHRTPQGHKCLTQLYKLPAASDFEVIIICCCKVFIT